MSVNSYISEVRITETAVLNNFAQATSDAYTPTFIDIRGDDVNLTIEDGAQIGGLIRANGNYANITIEADELVDTTIQVSGINRTFVAANSHTLINSELDGFDFVSISGLDGRLTVDGDSALRLGENAANDSNPVFADNLYISTDVQLDGAVFLELNLENLSADDITVTGELSGDGVVTVYGHNTIGSQGDVVLATAYEGITGAFDLNVIDGGEGVDFALRAEDDDLVLNVSVSQQSVLNQDQLQTLLDDNSGVGDADAITTILDNAADRQAAALAFTGTGHAATVEVAGASGLNFGRGLFSCAVGEGQFAPIDEGRCGWTRIEGGHFSRDEEVGAAGASQTVFGMTAGYQTPLDDHLRLGFGFGVDRLTSSTTDGGDADGVGFRLGTALKYVDAPLLFGGSLSVGAMDVDTTRDTGLGVATGSFTAVNVAAVARAAALVTISDGMFLKPQIEGGVNHVYRSGFDEAGAGGANLQVAAAKETVANISPSLDLLGDYQIGGLTIRPFASVGATWLSKDEIRTTAGLDGLAGTFITAVATDNLFADIGIGATIFSDNGLSARVSYSGAFSNNTETHTGTLKLQWSF